ncbi:MAG: hypothetical protein ACYC1L_19055 [Alphaproteobacteria bacterium]
MTDTLGIEDEKDLGKVAAKPSSLYQDVPLVFLTAYSLFWLHEWKIRRTIEAIAVLNWRLFPKKFSMVGFDEYPDAFRTNRSLLQMQPKYRNLLTGAATKGFSLNAHGTEKAYELIKVLGAPDSASGKALGDAKSVEATAPKRQARSIEPEREMARLRNTKLFKKWRGEGMTDRDLIHVHALLGIFDHTPPAVRVRAFKELEGAANKANDENAIQFLNDIRRAFPQVLAR